MQTPFAICQHQVNWYQCEEYLNNFHQPSKNITNKSSIEKRNKAIKLKPVFKLQEN